MHSFYGTRLSENMAETPEGYLICYDVKIARIGSQDYLGSELGVEDDVVKVNRPPEEVFNPATVASFEGKPFTNDHPYNLLDVNNTSIYEKGHVQNVRVSDDKIYLIADIMVKDSQTIQDIKNGKRELSAGYNCDCLQDEAGNWYQANIIGNHVALVDKGRAGEKVRINDAEFNEQDHPRGKDGKFTSGGGSEGGSTSEKSKKNTSSNSLSSLNEKEKRGIDIALTLYGQEFQKRGNEGTYKASQELREKVKNGEELSSEDIKSIQIALNATGAEEAKEIANKLDGETSKEKSESGDDTNKKRAQKSFELAQKVLKGEKLTEEEQAFLKEPPPSEKEKSGGNGASKSEKTQFDKPIENRKRLVDIPEAKVNEVSKVLSKIGADEYNHDQELQSIAFLIESGGAKRKEVEEWALGDELNESDWSNLTYAFEECGIAKYDEKEDMLKPVIKNKEKPMKDNKSVLGKLLKAFAKDAEPEEMVEALEAVKGKEDAEPDRLTKLETMVQDLCSRMDAYDEATKQADPEVTALDEFEKELEDEEPEKKEEEVKDEDANNDPKLIEAQAEKAQNDEDTTEEIKKEISDAKKVIAKIEDKETRLAVADSLAKVIRGKMKSSANYKKLMDAATKKPSGGSQAIDYSAVFKKIKEEKFRK